MPGPVRVLLTIPNFDTAGSGLVVLDLLRCFDRTKILPVVCVQRLGGLDQQVRELGFSLLCAPFFLPTIPGPGLLPRIRQAATFFNKLDVDVWHSWHYLGDYTEPLIARFAGVRRWIFTKKNLSWGSRSWHLRSLLASRIVVNNPEMVELFFHPRIYRRKTVVIPQGVDHVRFTPNPSVRAAVRARWGVPDGALFLGAVGRLDLNKDPATLIQAVGAVKSDVVLVFVGKGESDYVEQLTRLTDQLGLNVRVKFAGVQPNEDLPEFLSALDLFMLGSHHEGLPVALLEAMACGCACIVARNSGTEPVIDHETNGILVEPGRVEEFSGSIDRLAIRPELRKALGDNARRTVTDRFSAAAQARGYEDLYVELASLKRSA